MSWPKLSVELTGPKAPNVCQACGAVETPILPRTLGVGKLHQRWREHDANDAPTRTIVILCPTCADRLIEKHPRLYSHIERMAPLPGCMTLCIDCPNRNGTGCTHPDLTANGGNGLTIIGPKATNVHVCRRGKGARSGWLDVYPWEPIACAGLDPGLTPNTPNDPEMEAKRSFEETIGQ